MDDLASADVKSRVMVVRAASNTSEKVSAATTRARAPV